LPITMRFFSLFPPPPTPTLFPYTTLFRSVAAGDGHLLAEIRVVLEEDGRRHHLRDAGNRPLCLRVLFPEDFVRLGVIDDGGRGRSEEHTSELQSPDHLVCRLLLEKKKYAH